MICPICQKEITFELIETCRVLSCPNKTPVTHIPARKQLFTVSGNGFTVDNVNIPAALEKLYFPS